LDFDFGVFFGLGILGLGFMFYPHTSSELPKGVYVLLPHTSIDTPKTAQILETSKNNIFNYDLNKYKEYV
jgi:hypothetical protein